MRSKYGIYSVKSSLKVRFSETLSDEQVLEAMAKLKDVFSPRWYD